MKLYEIANEYESALQALSYEEVTENFLDGIKDQFDNKCIAVAKYIKNLESEEAAVKDAINNMRERADRLSKKISSLSGYLKENIKRTGIDEPIKCPEFEIKINKNPPALLIEDESLLPEVYFVKKEVKTIDKTTLKKDILEGFEVDGAKVIQDTRLVIK